jgi:hypothetical protein
MDGARQTFVLDRYIGNTLGYLNVKLIGGRYARAWWGLRKLYSTSHSVRLRLKTMVSAVILPRLMSSSCSVRLNRSLTALSLGVLIRDQ